MAAFRPIFPGQIANNGTDTGFTSFESSRIAPSDGPGFTGSGKFVARSVLGRLSATPSRKSSDGSPNGMCRWGGHHPACPPSPKFAPGSDLFDSPSLSGNDTGLPSRGMTPGNVERCRQHSGHHQQGGAANSSYLPIRLGGGNVQTRSIHPSSPHRCPPMIRFCRGL